jgi:trehalose 6-phosphate synthase
MRRLVCVSNRVMTSRKAAQAGGVAVALSDIMQSTRGLWFGWSGEIEDGPGQVDIAADDGGATLATLPMTRQEHEGFYLGYSNAVLWPVFHNRIDLAKFEAGTFESYVQFNRKVAAALAPLLRPDDIIWVHDYHFIPLAQDLRRLGARNPMGFFLHITMPPAEAYLAIPEHRLLSSALSNYDLIGLQTSRDVANTARCLEASVAGERMPDGKIRIGDRMPVFDSFPIGIKPSDFLLKKKNTGAPVQDPRRVLGVDRLDYTKGLPQKFRAFQRFLEKYPEHRRAVVLTQIAAPTRGEVNAYSNIRKDLERVSGAVNGTYGDLDWVPVQYIHRATARRKLGDIYRSAAVALVTPLADGMNLMAKEYVAAQDPENPGVLILSQFAGAAEQLQTALLINPHHRDEVADALHRALAMDRLERVQRHTAMMASVVAENSDVWWRSFIDRLGRIATARCAQSVSASGLAM